MDEVIKEYGLSIVIAVLTITYIKFFATVLLNVYW